MSVEQSQQYEALKGARIQVVPRASVGYTVPTYEGVRKDRNTTAWERNVGVLSAGVPMSEYTWSDGMERQEKVEWSVWPPKRVAHYPFGKTLLLFPNTLSMANCD